LKRKLGNDVFRLKSNIKEEFFQIALPYRLWISLPLKSDKYFENILPLFIV